MEKEDRQYLLTERAHLMCPLMNFGILFEIKRKYESDKVLRGIQVLQKAHPFLKSLIACDGSKYWYERQEVLPIELIEMDSVDAVHKDFMKMEKKGWDVRSEPLLRVIAYPEDEHFSILFVAHHLLCDGRGLLQLVEEFADYYCKDEIPSLAEECLIRSLKDLPEKSDLPSISRFIINRANKCWMKENHQVSYSNYLSFEKEFLDRNKISRTTKTLTADEYEDMRLICKQCGISINDYLIAKMMLDEHTQKVVIAADIRNQLSCYKKSALGNYSTAFGVEVRSKTNHFMTVAKSVSEKIKHISSVSKKQMLVLACYLHMDPELIDAVAISTLGSFESKAGLFVGTNMFGYKKRNGFSITNLGRIESDSISEASFFPPASPANKKTVGVLTVNGIMKISEVQYENKEK